jgi:glycosyltransferase involved in cell wall biosynthesis
MHIGVEATNLRSQQLGGVWRCTESLIAALGRLESPHRYSLLFLNAFKPWARVPPPCAPSPTMRLVEVTGVSNFLFTFFFPSIPRGWGGPTVESFLGPVDVFHSVNAVALSQREGRRVVTIHDLTCLRFPQFHPWARRMLFRLGIRRAARVADAIIVPSSATKRDLAAWPAAERKIHVIPWAPREQFVPLDSAETRRVLDRYSLADRGYLLFVGNIEPRKNLLALIEAYNRLRERLRRAPGLAIAGGAGWKNEVIHRAAAASPFAADIRFLGHVPEPELPAVMNGALGFVYPSFYEGFGLPPLEAMACGTPVITSTRSSLPEVVGEAALLVDPEDRAGLADAMARIVTDDRLREDLRERGLKQAQRFSWEQTARLTLGVYETRSKVTAGPYTTP